MPKLKESPKQKMDRAFLAAIVGGQARRGENNQDTIRLLPVSTSAFYNHLRCPDMFTREELLILIPRYFDDRQLCDAFGVEYRGGGCGTGRSASGHLHTVQEYQDALAGAAPMVAERILAQAAQDPGIGPFELRALAEFHQSWEGGI